MKKAIRPPENWQDFENLCKKLFGEIWGCPHSIKKNGRLGQPQAGIDVYGKPKGETEYWGIQCKGKDNYINSKLTKKEIDTEIKNALNFIPKLKTLIFATTASKDVAIEEYIRIKDIESCKNGNFEILLYSWQDLADFIEENSQTFNWYVNEKQFKEQFDFEIQINTNQENNTLQPKFLRTITQYKLETETEFSKSELIGPRLLMFNSSPMFNNKVNYSWCKLEVQLRNTGSVVIEDWKLYLQFENVQKVDDDFTKDVFMYKSVAPHRTCWAFEKELQIGYFPLAQSPLIQKDGREFKCFCIPNFDTNEVKIKWSLLARNFDKEGEIILSVNPIYETKIETKYVNNKSEVTLETNISEFIESKKQK